jgi:hypothetical protein
VKKPGIEKRPSALVAVARGLDGQHRAGPDDRLALERVTQAADADQRLRRIERHLQAGEAGADDRLADRDRLVGLKPAQDGDEREGFERGGNVEAHRLAFQIRWRPRATACSPDACSTRAKPARARART